MQTWHCQAADQVAAADLHTAFAAAFADYILGPFALPLAQWPTFLARQGVDLALSRVAWLEGEIAALALVAPRARSWRLATMGALPHVRGCGLAPALLDDLIGRAQAQGLQSIELEVIAQNPRAVHLYQRYGLVARQTLHGYQRPADTPVDGNNDREGTPVHREQALDWLRASEVQIPDLPLQVCAGSIAALTNDWQAWQHGTAQVVFSRQGDVLTIHSLIDRQSAQQDAARLLRQLAQHFAALAWDVPLLQRQDVGGDALLTLGCQRSARHQYWMQRRW